MKVSFIASEYNPFHNGHQYHIQETKNAGADAVVCIMSGNFVQRGSIAVCDKYLRAEMALKCGVDLVLELPVKFAISTASYFADGFVKTAAATGLQGYISFGAVNSIELLQELKNIIFSDRTKSFIENECKDLSFTNAVNKYLDSNFPEKYSSLLKDANSILAIEYIRARDLYFKDADIIAVKRNGVLHNDMNTSESFASASYLRNILYNSGTISDISAFIPDAVSEILYRSFNDGVFPASEKQFSDLIFARLLSKDITCYSKINNVSGGLENRIYEAIQMSSNLEEAVYNISTKRYPVSRIRQILLSAALEVTKDDILNGPSYIRVLGFNDKGRELLSLMRDSAALPVISNLSQVNKLNQAAQKDAYIDNLAGKLFNLCICSPKKGSPEYQGKPVII